MRSVLFAGGFALVISLLGTRVAITWFTRIGAGQPIRDDGPTTHHTKRGTPTMGGLVIVLASVLGYFIATFATGQEPSASVMLLIFLFVGLGTVGFLDDYIKISRQRSLGLRSRAKFIGQTFVALVFGWLALSPWLEDGRGQTPAGHAISFIRDPRDFTLPVIVLLLTAGLAAAIWRGRRFGPLVPERLPVTVRAAETTEGRARLYAHARDAVYSALATERLLSELGTLDLPVHQVSSQAQNRQDYLQRPDHGRQLAEASTATLAAAGECDVAIVLADGLSATAINLHAVPLLAAHRLVSGLRALGTG